jgi:hypothetical protein
MTEAEKFIADLEEISNRDRLVRFWPFGDGLTAGEYCAQAASLLRQQAADLSASKARCEELEAGLREIADFPREKLVMLGPGFGAMTLQNRARSLLEGAKG